MFFLAGMVILFGNARLGAAPLTWFPGPAIDAPLSGAMTVVSGGNNILVGGDSYYAPNSYPQSLAATNAYWNYLYTLYAVSIAGGAVVSDGTLIIYGGTDGTTSLNTVIAYSLSGDTVPTPNPMSVARSYFGYAPDRNANAYAFGGLDDSNNPLASAERYNSGNNTWSAIASLPAARYDFPAVFNRTNYIYIFGGITDPVSGTEIASVLRYSVSGNSWSNLAAMPVAVAGSAATLGPDGKIYVVGGTSGGVATDLVQVYNPAANSWTLSTPLPEALNLAAAGVDSLGRLIVMGGMDINGNDVADVWRSQLLNAPDTVPVFVAYPATVGATYQVPYVSSITATGNPQPTYVLINGPSGMAVDTYSGAITWTPQGSQIGSNSVTIRATNYAGSVDWSYNLTVPNPPPTPVTNLTVVSVTENSVTLSWNPEDPLVGPTTYTVYLRHFIHDPKGSGGTVWYTQIGSSVTAPTITIGGLAAGLAQTYYITASAPGGTSGYATISATTLSPQPPMNLRATAITSTSVTLAWDAPTGAVVAVRYEIWGWINNGVNYSSYGANFTGTSTTITGLTPGSVHEWGIRSFDAAGNVSRFDYGPTIYNPAPAPAALVSIGSPPGAGGFQFAVQASAVQTTLIQATTDIGNPASWVTIATNPPGSAFIFTDTNSSQFANRYYRVVSP